MVLLAPFRADPIAHALPTPSGRIELYSERIAGFAPIDHQTDSKGGIGLGNTGSEQSALVL